MQQDAPVLIEQSGPVLTITLNRPEAANAINSEMSDAIGAALAQAEDDPSIAVIVIGAVPGKAFSAGADLKAVSRGENAFNPDGTYGEWGLAGCTGRLSCKPVIAAVDGLAFGGGFEIVLAADILIASEKARFCLPEVKVGLMAGAGGAIRLPLQLPRKIAMDLLLTGDPLDAVRAHQLGLVSRLVEPGTALQAAQELAQRISRNAPLGLRGTKEVALGLVDGVSEPERAAWALNDASFGRILGSEDAREGAKAFAEKRPPQWSGR